MPQGSQPTGATGAALEKAIAGADRRGAELDRAIAHLEEVERRRHDQALARFLRESQFDDRARARGGAHPSRRPPDAPPRAPAIVPAGAPPVHAGIACGTLWRG